MEEVTDPGVITIAVYHFPPKEGGMEGYLGFDIRHACIEFIVPNCLGSR